jgi:hypothetical protein
MFLLVSAPTFRRLKKRSRDLAVGMSVEFGASGQISSKRTTGPRRRESVLAHNFRVEASQMRQDHWSIRRPYDPRRIFPAGARNRKGRDVRDEKSRNR